MGPYRPIRAHKGPYGPQPGPGPNPDWAPTRARVGSTTFSCKIHILTPNNSPNNLKETSPIDQSGLGPGPGWGPYGPIWALIFLLNMLRFGFRRLRLTKYRLISGDLGGVYTSPTCSKPKTRTSDYHFLRG